MSTPAAPHAVPPVEWPVDLVDDASKDTRPIGPVPGRRWFGWSLTSLPVAPLLLLGMLLGPQGLSILTPAALGALDPALPVALALLGALVGLMPGLQPPVLRALRGTAMTALVTALLVSAGFGVGTAVTGEQSRATLWLLPLVLGISAASSLLVPVQRPGGPGTGQVHTLESEALVSIVAGGLLLAFVRQGTLVGTTFWLLQACAVVTVLGLAGYLLLRCSVASAERRVFAIATLLLVGGAADLLSSSALLGGVCAGLLWNAGGGPSRDSLERDMRYAMPPLIALVLLAAGARVELSSTSMGLAAAYAFLRTLGRVAAGTLVARLDSRMRERRFSLLPPGVFGVAFALNAVRAIGPDLSIAISVVVVGTILSELTALLVTPRGATE